MHYSKPTVRLLGDAVRTVQEVPKEGNLPIDGEQSIYTPSPAYDLDE